MRFFGCRPLSNEESKTVTPDKVRYYIEKFAQELHRMPAEAHGTVLQGLANDFNYRAALEQKAAAERQVEAQSKAQEAMAEREREAKFGVRAAQ